LYDVTLGKWWSVVFVRKFVTTNGPGHALVVQRAKSVVFRSRIELQLVLAALELGPPSNAVVIRPKLDAVAALAATLDHPRDALTSDVSVAIAIVLSAVDALVLPITLTAASAIVGPAYARLATTLKCPRCLESAPKHHATLPTQQSTIANQLGPTSKAKRRPHLLKVFHWRHPLHGKRYQ
jgi:hypothetical protein